MFPITLKQLRYFDAIARHLHFGRAAEACCVTQPALSMQILELERTLGVTLVERARGGLKLTAAGNEVAARAVRLLRETDDLVAYCGLSHGLLSGSLRLGMIPTLAPYLLPALLAHLKANYPGLQLHVRESQTRPLVDELMNGKLDCIALALPVEGPELATMPLFDDRFLLAVPEGYPLKGHARATPDLIAADRLLLLEEGHCLRDQALTYCDLQRVNWVNTLGISTLSTIAGMVAAGHGITLLPEICLHVETRGRTLMLAPFEIPEPFRTIGLAWRPTSPREADFHELGRLLRACQPKVADWSAWPTGPAASPRAEVKARSKVTPKAGSKLTSKAGGPGRAAS